MPLSNLKVESGKSEIDIGKQFNSHFNDYLCKKLKSEQESSGQFESTK